jgi:chemotaxis family two-component system response regulator Rcp1
MTEQQTSESTPIVVTVEDNPADVRLIEEGVDAAGIELDLEVIHSGQRAIEQLTTIDAEASDSYPDLVLLDLNLPGKSGFEVLAAIRTETAFQDVPVVVVSSSENSDDIRRVYESSANAYVMKPADPDEYIRMVDAAIEFWITNVTPSPTND